MKGSIGKWIGKMIDKNQSWPMNQFSDLSQFVGLGALE